MPTTPEQMTRFILKNRTKISDHEQIKKISLYLFSLAITNKKAAEAFLEENHRFLHVLASIVSEEQLMKFSRANSQELVDKLVLYAKLDGALAAKMRNAGLNKPKNDEVNAYLQIIRNKQEQEPRQPIPPENGRTLLAIKNNKEVVKKYGEYGVNVSDEFIPIVTRHTRDFNKKLYSVGSSNSREIILLDPEDKILQELYTILKKKLGHSSNPTEILEVVKTLTKTCFADNSPDQFISSNLAQGKKVISLSEFILHGQGVCRHHTLLNSYFLSRLVSDGILQGEVIHHRQDFDKGAHTWSLFHDRENGKVYSLDSLWNNLTCITDNPGSLNRLYNSNVEDEIHSRYFTNKPVPGNQRQGINAFSPKLQLPLIKEEVKNFINWEQQVNPVLLQEPNNLPHTPSLIEKINEIKSNIEIKKFEVGNYLLFQGGRILTLNSGEKKRVPHRIYEIYEAIKNHSNYSTDPHQATKLWDEINKHAHNGINNPRNGRHIDTTKFYREIIQTYKKEENDNAQLPTYR